MPPRGFTNPAPLTESAREARKSFFCELCQKGYSRMNEFEAHESSYDHQHKKRLKEMKQMQRDPLASSKARKAERKADEKSGLITIKPLKLDGSSTTSTAGNSKSTAGGTGTGSGFKKSGFKSAFASAPVENSSDSSNQISEGQNVDNSKPVMGGFKKIGTGGGDEKTIQEKIRNGSQQQQGRGGQAEDESDTEDEGYEMYDPRHPTD